MIDYEVMKVGGTRDGKPEGYVIQVNQKLYVVEDRQRHLSKNKLIGLFARGEFKLYTP